MLGQNRDKKWHFAMNAVDCEPGDAITVQIGRRHIAIFCVSGEFFATDNRCTHAGAPLADGYLDGEVIECPLHQGLFNVRTGKALCSPALAPVATYPVRVVDGKILVYL
jgi:naphthalene 1,2-dioxygenase ferredoxin component